MSTLIRRLKANEIRDAAETVLNRHQLERTIPVDIEAIIDFGFDIEIRFMTAMRSRIGFEGALFHDLRTILIDEDSLKHKLNRYRFTLAHELGHVVLHGDYISSMTFEEKVNWKKSVEDIDSVAYGLMESQAYTFAGHLLVPRDALEESCIAAQQKAFDNRIDFVRHGLRCCLLRSRFDCQRIQSVHSCN